MTKLSAIIECPLCGEMNAVEFYLKGKLMQVPTKAVCKGPKCGSVFTMEQIHAKARERVMALAHEAAGGDLWDNDYVLPIKRVS